MTNYFFGPAVSLRTFVWSRIAYIKNLGLSVVRVYVSWVAHNPPRPPRVRVTSPLLVILLLAALCVYLAPFIPVDRFTRIPVRKEFYKKPFAEKPVTFVIGFYILTVIMGIAAMLGG